VKTSQTIIKVQYCWHDFMMHLFKTLNMYKILESFSSMQESSIDDVDINKYLETSFKIFFSCTNCYGQDLQRI